MTYLHNIHFRTSYNQPTDSHSQHTDSQKFIFDIGSFSSETFYAIACAHFESKYKPLLVEKKTHIYKISLYQYSGSIPFWMIRPGTGIPFLSRSVLSSTLDSSQQEGGQEN